MTREVIEGRDQEEDDDSEIMACTNPGGREKTRARKLLSVTCNPRNSL